MGAGCTGCTSIGNRKPGDADFAAAFSILLGETCETAGGVDWLNIWMISFALCNCKGKVGGFVNAVLRLA